MNILTKFGSNYSSGFREDDYNKQHPFWHFWAFVSCTSDHKKKNPLNSQRTIQWTFLPSLLPIGPVVSEETITLFPTFGPLVLLCTFDQQKNHSLLNERSNEHSYQVCFQLAQWFQRRPLKQHFLTHLGLLFLLCTSDHPRKTFTSHKTIK
jgi:hypothetical protein